MSRDSNRAGRRVAGCGLARIASIGFACLLFCGCASRASGPAMAAPELVWPAPPVAARVAFVQAIRGPKDLGIKPSLWQRLRHAIGGVRRREMVRPSAVAVAGGLLAVADPGAEGVHLFDRERSSYRFISGCGAWRWVQPIGICFLSGRMYVSDSARRSISVLTSSGECISTWEPLKDGRPTGLAADAGSGRILVADTGTHQVRLFSPDGVPMGEFGSRGSRPGEFNFPGWLAVGKDAEVYVVDSLNFRIQLLDIRGGAGEIFGEAGDSAGYFARPKGIALDSRSHIYVVDALFDTVQIFDQRGRLLLTFGERGTRPGQFWLPSGIFIDDEDFIYVADSYNRRVEVFRFLGGE